MYWNSAFLYAAVIGNRLTLTWDVLKYIYLARFKRVTSRLTLTWDVLK